MNHENKTEDFLFVVFQSVSRVIYLSIYIYVCVFLSLKTSSKDHGVR
jgi:hypothetical protein